MGADILDTINLNLNTLAKLTLLGLAYVYTVRMIDTLYHGIFSPAALTMAILGLNILAGLIQLLFFIAFYRQFVPREKQALKVAAWLAMIGSAIAMLPKFLTMALLFQNQHLFLFLRYANQIRALCPLLSATLLWLFCMIFLVKYRFNDNGSLRYAFALGTIGWLTMAAARFLVLLNYVTAGQLTGLADFMTAGPFLFVTVSSITLVSLSFFYYTFSVIDRVKT